MATDTPRTDSQAEKLRDLLTNRQMPDRATMTLTLGELRAAFGEDEHRPHQPHACSGHPLCDLGEDHGGRCWFESGTDDD